MLGVLIFSLVSQLDAAETDKMGAPEITDVSLVAPGIIALTIEAQRVVLPKLERYVPQPGDEKKPEYLADGKVKRAKLIRNGKDMGWLQGKDLDWFSTYEGLEGEPLTVALADDPASFQVSSPDDGNYRASVQPTAVYRKSMPSDWQLQANLFPVKHRIYLRMPTQLTAGKIYEVKVRGLNVENPDLRFVYDSRNLRSEAVHVNQIGYRPDDPAKNAFLSIWLGTGGAHAYPEGLNFTIIDEANGRDVFSGPVMLNIPADQKESIGTNDGKNHNLTSVYKMSFDGLTAPGRYRLQVEGIGCSYPFEIGEKVWEKAYLTQMRGLYHNRSGIELGPPYTSFRKPRDFHPADGFVVTRTSYNPLTKGNESYDDIAKGNTGEPEPEGWGGYHDAGDWNPRRASHLPTTMALLENMELFPAYFSELKLNIPSTPGLPDMMTEALWGIDFFRRLQREDGSVPYGIETQGDPLVGEISWLSNMQAYVLAPNIRDTWQYATAAALAAKVLRPIDGKLADVYFESARRAFAWAEAEYQRQKKDGSLESYKEVWRATDFRNFSALILYDLTNEKNYHDIFREDTCLKDPYAGTYWWEKYMQSDTAFYYARLDDAKADPILKKNAIAAVVRSAEDSLSYAAGNAFNVTNADKYRPLVCGVFSTAGGKELVRAHYLTGEHKYLAGAVRSCQFGAGCNPNNLVYTTGLGANPVLHPLHLDSRSSGQPAPEGLTTFGNADYWNNRGGFWDWPMVFLSKQPSILQPDPYEWPLAEAYFDIFLFVSMNEYVVDTWAPNVLVWGYLAARPASQ